jgi:hypothetical protein
MDSEDTRKKALPEKAKSNFLYLYHRLAEDSLHDVKFEQLSLKLRVLRTLMGLSLSLTIGINCDG